MFVQENPLDLLTSALDVGKHKFMNLAKACFYSLQKSFCALQNTAPLTALLTP